MSTRIGFLYTCDLWLTQAQFKFTKRLEGKELTAGVFEFELLENGNVIQTKPNVADGSITFDAIEYSVEGEHTYIVREKAGTDTNIDYDTMNAEVKVKVTKDAKIGLLSAAVTIQKIQSSTTMSFLKL